MFFIAPLTIVSFLGMLVFGLGAVGEIASPRGGVQFILACGFSTTIFCLCLFYFLLHDRLPRRVAPAPKPDPGYRTLTAEEAEILRAASENRRGEELLARRRAERVAERAVTAGL